METIEPANPIDPINASNHRTSVHPAHSPQPSAQLATILAPILTAQLQQAGLPGCSASPASPAAVTAAAEEGAALSLCLHMEGALSGLCYFSVSLDQANRIAASATSTSPSAEVAPVDPVVWFASVLQACCDPFATALSASYGSVHVNRAEDLPVPPEATPVAYLLLRPDGAEPGMITIFGEDPLVRALQRFDRVAAAAGPGLKEGNLGLVMDVELNVTLRFGQRQLSLREVMELASGSVVELDREVDEPVELILDGRVIARGEAVIVDGNYGVRVTEVLQPVVM